MLTSYIFAVDVLIGTLMFLDHVSSKQSLLKHAYYGSHACLLLALSVHQLHNIFHAIDYGAVILLLYTLTL